jgi:hypothetical protein
LLKDPNKKSGFDWIFFIFKFEGTVKNIILVFMLQRADLAICDLTITYDRRSAVDFTMPFMTLGKDIFPLIGFLLTMPIQNLPWLYKLSKICTY